MSTDVTRSLSRLLESAPQAPPLNDILTSVDSFILECTSSPEPEILLYNLEEELQTIHRDVVDHDSREQTEIFLAVLCRLIPVISSTSLISTWFDLVLRPALRDPKLSATGISSAKELVIVGLVKVDENYPAKQGEFRRHLLDLYLLDAYNEGSGDDVLEWAELSEEQRERRRLWKSNLEDILVQFGLEQPEALFTQIFNAFASTSSRLQLFILLNRYTSQLSFESHASVLAAHSLMSSILTSLLVDNSTTVCTIALSVLTKLLPIFAVKASHNLKAMLPRLFAILARIICWQERQPTDASAREEDLSSDSTSQGDPDEITRQSMQSSRALNTRADLDWQRLELTFVSAAAPAPSPRRFFTFLYYLYPCNLLSFLRRTAHYLTDASVESPYSVGWMEALDIDQIKTKSEVLLRAHITHPLIIWRNATNELNNPDFFERYDVPRIVTECMRLEVRNSRLERPPQVFADDHQESEPGADTYFPLSSHDVGDTQAVEEATEDEFLVSRIVQVPSTKTKISLQDMVNTSIALKSNAEIEIVDPTPAWPYALFTSASISSATPSVPLAVESSGASSQRENEVPVHIAQAISGLQREVLLLRNELNFELWLTRENMKQIGVLYEQRIVKRNAEMERQGLHNALRDYKNQVTRLQHQLKDQKEQSDMAKKKYGDWNDELQQKIRDLRDQKRSWVTETASLRQAEKELRAQFTAQGKLLAEAANRVFQLESSIKENAHKVDRLKDYERQIEQLTTLQKLWDVDVQKYKSQTEVIKSMLSKYKKMELRLETYEKTHSEMEEHARASRRQIQTLEAQLALAFLKHQKPHIPPPSDAAYRERVSALEQDNERLRNQNEELENEVEEVKQMVEILRAQVSKSPGILSDVRLSPNIGSPLIL